MSFSDWALVAVLLLEVATVFLIVIATGMWE